MGRVRSLGGLGEGHRLRWILTAYLILVAILVGYNARSSSRERGAAIIVNVASRQRALGERYVKDVILRVSGQQADPEDDAQQLLMNAQALLHGGSVTAVQGADADIKIPPATDDLVVAKLVEERRLIQELVSAGHRLMGMDPDDPSFGTQLLQVRIVGAQVTSMSNDAVGQMTRDAEAAFARLVALGIGLGVLGAIAAIAMGLLMRRAGTRRSAQFRSLVHNASDLITVLDAAGMVRYQSPSGERFLGISSDAMVGTNYLDLLDPPDRHRIETLVSELAASSGSVATTEYRIHHTDGSSSLVESMVSSLLDDPNVRGLVLNTRDITDRKRLEEELAHQAFHDSLTGLSNRAVFRDRVDHALQRDARMGAGLTVLLLDLDGFKMINDSLGHDAGDELLVQVGVRLTDSGRSSDTIARLGGDEFAVLLEDDGEEERAVAVAERMLEGLMAPFEIRGRQVFVRASVGIAISRGGAATTDELIRNADTAMYAAKRSGKARIEVFRPAMHELALRAFEVQADLQRALDRGEFILDYQPIVAIEGEAVEGMEALVRWQHPTRGLIPPLEFIPIAEESGLIVPLGAWVLGEACRQTATWRATHPSASDLWVSVNLSTRQLLEPDLVLQVAEVLDASGLDPAGLVLEITEGSLLQDVDETVRKLQGLKDLGVRLAIDDFGTGSSSLGYLRRFPIDVLKIDKSFVDEVAGLTSEGPALVRAIIELAQTLHLDTVAEGIELTEQLDELRSAGCRSGQGFLFARPLRPDAMAEMLRAAGSMSTADRPADGVRTAR